MKIQSTQLSMGEVAETFHPSDPRDESKIHISDLRDTLLETLGLQRGKEKVIPQWVKNLGSFGLVWEKVVHGTIQEQAWNGGPPGMTFQGATIVEVDGIIGTLDGLILQEPNGRPAAVWENKTRWRAEELPTDNERYMIQAKAYCWMVGVTQCWFSVLNISARPPNMVQWLHIIDFTPQELMENWRSLLQMREIVERRKFHA